MHTEIDRHIENSGTLGMIHAQKEDVAPAGMREVHPHRRRFAEHWKGLSLLRSCAARCQ